MLIDVCSMYCLCRWTGDDKLKGSCWLWTVV